MAIYDDSLQNGWENWSWATVNVASATAVRSGTYSVSVVAGGWQALYLHKSGIDSSSYTGLSFWVSGGASGGQQVRVRATIGGSETTGVVLSPLPTNAWRFVSLTLASLGVANEPNFDGLQLQSDVSGWQPMFHVDDMKLLAAPVSPPGTTAVTIAVDVLADRHPISPLVYGVCDVQ